MRLVALFAGLLIAFHSHSPSQPSPAREPHTISQLPDVRGIFVSSYGLPPRRPDSLAVMDALNVPGVDGLYMVISWRVLEPGKGLFNWFLLDNWMNFAIRAGKKIELSIPGELTPDWLFEPGPNGSGVSPLYFTFTRRPTDTTCLSDTLARPWDTTFLGVWDTMLDSVSAHLKAVKTYDAVSLVRLTGINKDSDELHLPEQGSPKAPCAQDNVATWLAAGYRPSRLLQGWDGITSSFKKHFPDKIFSVAIIASSNPFPPITEDSTIYPKDSIPDQNFPLLMLASQKLQGQLVIQNNSLYPGEPAQSETVQAAESLKTMIAFQTNEDVKAHGAGCGHRGSPDDTTTCTDSTYLSELHMGIYPKGPGNSLRAQYLEVFALNVNATPGDILVAHNELFAPGPTSVRLVNPEAPHGFTLGQNYPNPFNPATTITFEISHAEFVSLRIYDMLGRVVATPVSGMRPPGTYAVRFDASGLSSGEYVYRFKAGTYDESRTMMLIK